MKQIKNVINSLFMANNKKEEIPVYRNKIFVQDLDKFFKEVYTYYYLGGYKFIKKQIILDVIIYLFTVHFIMFIFFCIEWDKLFNININQIDAGISSSINSTNINASIYVPNMTNITNNTFINNDGNYSIYNNNNNSFDNKSMVNNKTIESFYELKNYISFSSFYKHKTTAIIFYFLFMHYLIGYFYSCIIFLKKMKYIKNIYKNKFCLNSKDLERISFNNILDLLIDLQNKENYCRVKDTLSKFDIICRICRKDNYVTALSFFNLLNFKVFGIDLMTNFIYQRFKSEFMTMLFNDNEAEINKNIYNKKFYKVSLIVQIIFQIIRIPPEIILRITFFLIKKVDKFQSKEKVYKNRWDRTNLLVFKNYNELKHNFRRRITKSYTSTYKFLRSFRNKNLSVVFHTIKLICGFLLLFLFLIILFVGPNISNIRIFNTNFVCIAIIIILVIWLLNNLDGGTGIASADTIENYDEKKNYFRDMVKYLKNIPDDWEKEKICRNYKCINKSYLNLIYHFIIEILSVLFQPLLWIKLINNYNEITSFIKMFSIDIEGIGTVCAFSVLNIKEYKKIRDKVNELYKKNNITKNCTIKFLNSLIYFEKYFSYNKVNVKNDLENNNEKDNEVIIVDEERIFLKEKEGNGENDSYKQDEYEINIIDLIGEKIFNDFKGKINIDEIKENISYFINIDKKLNFDEIIQYLYEKKCSFVNV